MPSLSASVPASQLKVMRKPAVRQPGATSGTAVGSAVTGQPTASTQVAPPSTLKGGPNPVGGFRGMDGMGNVRPAIGGGFQFRPRDMVGVDPNSGVGSGGAGAGGGGIQDAIRTLRGQLGSGGPTVDPAGGGGSGGGDVAVSSSATAEPPWMQLQKMGVGGQGSAVANRAKLAELLAARNGGVSPPGADIGQGNPGPGVGVGGAASGARGAALRPPGMALPPSPLIARTMPGQIPDETGGALGPNPATATAVAGQPNPYMNLLRQRIGAGTGAMLGAGAFR